MIFELVACQYHQQHKMAPEVFGFNLFWIYWLRLLTPVQRPVVLSFSLIIRSQYCWELLTHFDVLNFPPFPTAWRFLVLILLAEEFRLYGLVLGSFIPSAACSIQSASAWNCRRKPAAAAIADDDNQSLPPKREARPLPFKRFFDVVVKSKNWMDPAAFATYQPPQGSGGGLFRPSSSPFNGGSGGGDHRRGPNSHHMRNIQNSNSGSNMMSSNGGSIPQVKIP